LAVAGALDEAGGDEAGVDDEVVGEVIAEGRRREEDEDEERAEVRGVGARDHVGYFQWSCPELYCHTTYFHDHHHHITRITSIIIIPIIKVMT
jgi:hypothetical protein